MSKTYTFSISPICFWIKGRIEVDDKLIKVKTSNTILGIFPVSSNRQVVPMSNVSTVQVRTGFLLGQFLIGMLFILGGMYQINDSFVVGYGMFFIARIIMILIGVSLMIAGMPVFLDIETAGNVRSFYAPIYEKNTIEQIADDINKKLEGSEDRKDVSAAADRIVDAINKEKD